MTVNLHTLTGAYALHATSDTERVAFRRHLAECVFCRHEVQEFHETAARLARATAASPPPHLRQAVLTRIHTERQTRTTRRRPRAVAVAAAVLVTVSLGVVLSSPRGPRTGASCSPTCRPPRRPRLPGLDRRPGLPLGRSGRRLHGPHHDPRRRDGDPVTRPRDPGPRRATS